MAGIPEPLSLEHLTITNDLIGTECKICFREFVKAGSSPESANANDDETLAALASQALRIKEEVEARGEMMHETRETLGLERVDSNTFVDTILAIFQLNGLDKRISPVGRSLGEQVVCMVIESPRQTTGEETILPEFLSWNIETRRFEGHAAIEWSELNDLLDPSLVERAIDELAEHLLRNPLAILGPENTYSTEHVPRYSTMATITDYKRVIQENTYDQNSRWYAWAARVELLAALERAARVQAQAGVVDQSQPRPVLWYDGTINLGKATMDLGLVNSGHNKYAENINRDHANLPREHITWYGRLMCHLTRCSTSEIKTWDSDTEEMCKDPVKIKCRRCKGNVIVGLACWQEYLRSSDYCLICRKDPFEDSEDDEDDGGRGVGIRDIFGGFGRGGSNVGDVGWRPSRGGSSRAGVGRGGFDRGGLGRGGFGGERSGRGTSEGLERGGSGELGRGGLSRGGLERRRGGGVSEVLERAGSGGLGSGGLDRGGLERLDVGRWRAGRGGGERRVARRGVDRGGGSSSR